MLVSEDEYELPLIVCDHAAPLARKLGVTTNAVLSAISHAERFGYRSRYVRVDYEEDEEPEE